MTTPEFEQKYPPRDKAFICSYCHDTIMGFMASVCGRDYHLGCLKQLENEWWSGRGRQQ